MNDDLVRYDNIIEKTKEYVKSRQSGEASGHDWWHTVRVYNTAMTIAEKENADTKIVALAALLHDIADYKFYDGDETIGPKTAREWLFKNGADENIINEITDIIANMSFKGAHVDSSLKTLEGKIVQDADRLDAIGAVGIARTFAYGGKKGRAIYNPDIPPANFTTFEEYKINNSSTINHFYEKLLLLKDLMNTQTARDIAEERHKFMENFLDRFLKEWDGNI